MDGKIIIESDFIASLAGGKVSLKAVGSFK
jgi:hypothetical protein